MQQRPRLVTFDFFGTVVDWRNGLEAACRDAGRPLSLGEFDRIVDRQGELERGTEFADYATITSRSLVDVLAMDPDRAASIGRDAGEWPFFPDAASLRSMAVAVPCAAMTNSDRAHGDRIRERLDVPWADWLCAEEARVYKPDPAFWHLMAARRPIAPGPDWWHVSAYADYDLDVAKGFGLTTVFVRRPHSRPGDASHVVADLMELAALLR